MPFLEVETQPETAQDTLMEPPRSRHSVGLFWRTFALLVLFMMVTTGLWLYITRTLDAVRPVPMLATLGLLITIALSLLAAFSLTLLINQPFQNLSSAIDRISKGDFEAGPLDEKTSTREIRAVNMGFNFMTQKFRKIEQERAIMLAGISHDLRTPLARLRLETEMSVTDMQARTHMVADIEQLNAIIHKFLDYARPNHVGMKAVHLNPLLNECINAIAGPEIRVQMRIPADCYVQGDSVELTRLFSNLLENARRYGKTANLAKVDIAVQTENGWAHIKLRDHGPGVPEDMLASLTKPFFRGDAARTEVTGAGLGLAIVEKTVERMGGTFSLRNSSTTGGLSISIKLRRAVPGQDKENSAEQVSHSQQAQ